MAIPTKSKPETKVFVRFGIKIGMPEYSSSGIDVGVEEVIENDDTAAALERAWLAAKKLALVKMPVAMKVTASFIKKVQDLDLG